MNPWGQPEHPGSHGPQPPQPAQQGQYGYQAPQLPQYPAYPGSNTPSSTSPSGGTGIAAAVLALLGSVAEGLGALGGFITLAGLSSAEWEKARDVLPGWLRPFLIASSVLQLAVAVALLVGGILLLRRRDGARMVIATSCVVVIVGAIAGLFFTLDLKHTLDEHGHSGLLNTGTAIASTVGGTLFPIVTLILVLLPSTKRWCQARDAGPQGAPAAYPPYR